MFLLKSFLIEGLIFTHKKWYINKKAGDKMYMKKMVEHFYMQPRGHFFTAFNKIADEHAAKEAEEAQQVN